MIAKEKLRLDLYNRRFEIFSSIFDLYEVMISWEGTAEQTAVRTRFFRAYQESGFLFRKESGIEDLLKQLNDEATKVIDFRKNPERYQSDPKRYIEHLQKMTDIQLGVFEEGLKKLKLAMSEYLNFHNALADPTTLKEAQTAPHGKRKKLL